MAKQLRQGEEVYIAPGIIGKRDEHKLVIRVNSSGKKLNPKKIEDKITIFEAQVNGWFLHPASNLLGKENNGFVVLMIATAYIEEVEQYRRGESSKARSQEFFENGIERIFGITVADLAFIPSFDAVYFITG